MDLSEFAGTPNSEKNNLPVEQLDMTTINEQNNEEIDIGRVAENVWKSGGAFAFIYRSCNNLHSGDRRVIRIMILSYVSTYCLNTYGMHINVSGDAGTGKSHCASTVSSHFPQAKVIKGRMSDKAIFHFQFPNGCLFILDDQTPSEDFEEIVKESTTDFHEETIYRSVKNGAAIEHKIPAESLFWLVKANIVGDEQTQDRMFNMRTDNSVEQLDAIKASIIEGAKDPSKVADMTYKLISRKIWDYVTPAYVSIPYADYIDNEERPEARNLNLFLDLIRTSALIHAPLRNRGPDVNGKPNIIASMHDFVLATRLMNPLMNNIGGSQKLKIDGNAQKILDYLSEHCRDRLPEDSISISMVRDALGFKPAIMSFAINGRSERGTEGLSKVCPAFEVRKETVPNCSGKGGTHQEYSIRWNQRTYEDWKGKSGMFVLTLPEKWEDGKPDWLLEKPTTIELEELDEISKDDEEEKTRIEREKQRRG